MFAFPQPKRQSPTAHRLLLMGLAGWLSFDSSAGNSIPAPVQRTKLLRITEATPATTVGVMDSTFRSAVGLNDNIWAVVLQSDGKIILGGTFIPANGGAAKHVLRLNTDGSADES